jgi:hypothetical protein
MASHKYGDVRADGAVFKGYDKTGYAKWYSPEAWHRQKLHDTLGRARKRAVAAGVPFDIDIEHLLDIFPEDGNCPVLVMPLVRGRADWGSSPSLDRHVPSLGYVRGNVSIISNRANTIKSDATLEDLERVTNYIRKNLN